MLDILERYGGWPVVKGDAWNAANWKWLEMLKNMSDDGLPTNFLFDVIIDVDQNDTTKHIIKVNNSIEFQRKTEDSTKKFNSILDWPFRTWH